MGDEMTRIMALSKCVASSRTHIVKVLTSCRQTPSLTLAAPLGSKANAENGTDEQTGSDVDLTDVLASGCELANVRASKVLAVRSEQHAALPLSEFVEIFKESWDFVVASETLAKRMIVSLRGVTASQVGSRCFRHDKS